MHQQTRELATINTDNNSNFTLKILIRLWALQQEKRPLSKGIPVVFAFPSYRGGFAGNSFKSYPLKKFSHTSPQWGCDTEAILNSIVSNSYYGIQNSRRIAEKVHWKRTNISWHYRVIQVVVLSRGGFCGEINTFLALNQCNYDGSQKNTPKSKYL